MMRSSPRVSVLMPSTEGKSTWPLERPRRQALSWVATSILFAAMAASASAGYVDGFEGPNLDPFWSQRAQSGSISLSPGASAHTGSHSVQFNSTNTGSDKWIWLEHTFAAPTYGSFSVWVYDTGADVSSSNYLYFAVDSTTSSERNSIFGNDYDLGPGQNGSTYSLNPNNHDTIVSGVDRTLGWHQFLIDITPAQATFKIDGSTIYTKPGVPMDRVLIAMFGPSWRPAWTSYFDDFEFRDTAAVPEPTSLSLALIGLGVMSTAVLMRSKRRAVSG